MPQARAATSGACLRHPTTPWPVRASPRRETGVTEPDGRFRLAPLGNGDRPRYFPGPFRTHHRACLQPGIRVVRTEEAFGHRSWASCQRSYLHGLSRASVAEPGQGGAVGTNTVLDPTKPTA